MITKICDICKSEVEEIETIVLHKKSFDYCNKCKNKAGQIKLKYEKEKDRQYKFYNNNLKTIENRILKF